jgi:hypothetical protein
VIASSEAEVLPPPTEGREGRLPQLTLAAAFARRHWLFFILLAPGIALRAVTLLAYRPALLNSDEYLYSSEHLYPDAVHPIGYPVFLRILPLTNGLTLAPLVQHILGLGLAALVYVLLLRLGVRTWLAALAAAPVLLDAYQLGIEQYLTPETLFELLLVGGCAAILWKPSLLTLSIAVGGLLFALATLTRTIAVLALVPATLTVLFLRVGATRVLAFALLFIVPLGAYAVWYRSIHGQFAITGSTGTFLYGRIAPLVDCDRFEAPNYERVLCPSEPVGQRLPVNELLWSSRFSPLRRIQPPTGNTRDEVAADFAKRTIVHQPGTYARALGSDVLRAFASARRRAPGEYGDPSWEFHQGFPTFFRGSVCSPEALRQVQHDLTILGKDVARRRVLGCERRKAKMTRTIRAHHGQPRINSRLIAFLRGYQRVGYAPGPLLAACLLGGFAAALGIGRARHSGLRSAAFLFAGVAAVVCLGSVVVTVFSWRYQIPQLALLPPAGALAVTALFGLREDSPTESEAAPAAAEKV